MSKKTSLISTMNKLAKMSSSNSNSNSYSITVKHDGLNKFQVIKAKTRYEVEQKALAKMAQWNEMWDRKVAAENNRLERERKALDKAEKIKLAAERTEEAQNKLSGLDSLLISGVDHKLIIKWDSLKKSKHFPMPKPKMPILSTKPTITDAEYLPNISFFDKLFVKPAREKELTMKKQFESDLKNWSSEKEKGEKAFEESMSKWNEERDVFIAEVEEYNEAIDERKSRYERLETDGIIDCIEIVLDNSVYPDEFPKNVELEYNPENKVLIIDYELPDIKKIDTLKEVKYIQTRKEYSEKHISETQLKKLYDSILYQTALRTLHEVFVTDGVNAIQLVVFNGYVNSLDPATGKEKTACILSLQAGKEEFLELDLCKVEPKACFKNLKGISSSKLYTLTPVAPIMKMNKEDNRFVSSYGVADDLGEEYNLAAMDWEDFEHLIREIFEEEFSNNGGEVKVTRASRDGGIDAVAFDPDPIRGGKIVIQAKRYTNTVGVSAVRDLYGAVINEGAAKGIIVTTSDYGSDSYEFAKGKPLTLLNGNNLLSLLEKHGHKAKIDLKEAKEILKNQQV